MTERDLPPGVYHDDRRPNRPFYIKRDRPQTGRQTTQSFATVEEAAAARKQEDEAVLRRQDERNEERRQAKKRKRDERTEALASKRAADLARNGNNCAIEREYTERLVEEAGGRSVVLNDFTLADWLLDVCDGDERFGNVQNKVTQKAIVDPRSKNCKKTWNFTIDSKEGAKYAGMFVVCYAMDVGIAWIFHGNDLANVDQIRITEGGKWDQKALAKVDGGPRDVVAFLREQYGKHAEGLVRTTEEEARNAFACESHRKEKEAIDLYEAFFPYVYEWPREQGSHVDRIERGPTVGCVGPVDARLQHKLAYPHGVGFQCTLYVCAGSQNGKPFKGPYPEDAFDFLVVTAVDEGNAHFWRIPMAALVAHRCLDAMKIVVHLPEGLGRKAIANNTSLWTREYYLC